MVKGLSMSIGFFPKECAKALMSAENILSFSNSFVVRKIIGFSVGFQIGLRYNS